MLADGKIVNKFLYKNWLNYFVATIGKTLRYLLLLIIFRSSHGRYSVKKGVFWKFANIIWKYLCCNQFLIKSKTGNKETPIQGFFCKICEIFKNLYFEEHLRTTASILSIITLIIIFTIITFTTIRNNRLEMFYKIGVLK